MGVNGIFCRQERFKVSHHVFLFPLCVCLSLTLRSHQQHPLIISTCDPADAEKSPVGFSLILPVVRPNVQQAGRNKSLKGREFLIKVPLWHILKVWLTLRHCSHYHPSWCRSGTLSWSFVGYFAWSRMRWWAVCYLQKEAVLLDR